ncbi:fatty acid desaturase-domain-containing protein [Dactylonectria estremocensis]|uniref:Delta 8-(E)-sphingolipid desaturase n=1 Tax=Dactylonectria estremocensis TaxID=1079267 RepID=A0A9P9E875_9HYPO|nr:fatty acid desaturase-domain-containing protein [Dactylonectria estremocensis]
MDRDQILNPCDVDSLIADGQTIVVYEDAVLRLDGWMDRHPGGRLAVLHMVGRDATDEMKSYHSKQTLKTMKAYRIGRKQGTWVNRTPPIRGGVYVKQTPIVDSDTEEDSADDGVSQVSSVCSCGLVHKDVSHKDGKDGLRHRGPCPIQTQGPNQKPSAHTIVANAAIEREIQKDLNIYPSLDPLVQEDIARKYQILHQQITDAGLYDCPYIDYGKEMIRYTILFTTFAVLLSYGWYLTSAIFLGLFWHQIMFTAHDGGHLAITSNFVVDTLIAMFVADFCCGLSIGWWKSSHNVHHLVTNYPEHDPDIQNVPLFATCPSFFKSLHSTYYDFTFIWDAAADFLVPYQKYTYYPVMGIARFNLYLLSWLHVISTRSSGLSFSKAWWIRPTEISFMVCYWYIFGYLLLWKTLPDWYTRVAFVLVSHIVTMPLHIQITLSHWGMSTVDLGESESFPQRQLRTTMDVDCPAWLDFIHGGLQFQAVHHLFPRLPRHNLRKAQVFTKQFCRDTGVPYSILSFVDGNQKVLGRLKDVGDQVRVLIDCQKHMAKTGESGLA